MKYCVALLLLPYFYLFPQADSGVIISEVMFYPQGSNTEFVEVYNQSEFHPVDIDSFKIKYSSSNPDIIISAGHGTILQPKSYAVILEGDYDTASGIYNKLIPAGALIVKIADNAFGTNGMANTSNRQIELIAKNGTVIDSYTYSANNQQGYSDERINLNSDTSAANWQNSLCVNGTPGYKNSVSKWEYDLAVCSIKISPQVVFQGAPAQITATVKNSGTKATQDFSVKMYFDENNNNLPEEKEAFYEKSYSDLLPDDSINVVGYVTAKNEGSYNIIAEAVFADDEAPQNNTLTVPFTVTQTECGYNDIVINEIMYAPANGATEWIELFNKSLNTINLKNWKMGDKTNRVTVTQKDVYLKPQNYIIITKDSSILKEYSISAEIVKTNFPALNNTGDAVVVSDSLGKTIDSLEYLPEWGGSQNGHSLERVNVNNNSCLTSNWGGCINAHKATPGVKNSITPADYDVCINEFYPENKTQIITGTNRLYYKIKNAGQKTTTAFKLSLYLDSNNDSIPQEAELMKSVEFNALQPGDSIFNHTDITNIKKGLNSYIAEVNYAEDEKPENSRAITTFTGYDIPEQRNDIIINEIMYAPETGRPEWVELYNRSTKPIDLNGFKLCDDTDSSTILKNSFIILPGEYIIAAPDSGILNYYKLACRLITAKLPSLNNNGDKVILTDSLNITIDSLYYLPAWGGSAGDYSLERKDAEAASTLQSNWGSSINIQRATPGAKNSIAVKLNDISVESFYTNDTLISIKDTAVLYVLVKNKGKLSAENVTLRLYKDTNNDSLAAATELIKTDNIAKLNSGDSILVQYIVYGFTEGINNYIIKTAVTNDEDTLNNNKLLTIKGVVYTENKYDLVINEIMYAPKSPECEWLEVFNRSAKPVNLKGYYLKNGESTYRLTEKECIISSGNYMVVAADSSVKQLHNIANVVITKIPQLNNTQGEIVLADSYMRTIDSLKYFSTWGGGSGKSVERINADSASSAQINWKGSKDKNGSTPGRKNSVSPPLIDICINDVQTTEPYQIYGSNISLKIKLRNNGINNAVVNLAVYVDTNNDSLAETAVYSRDNISISANDSLIINTGVIWQKAVKDIGFIIFAEAAGDEDTLNNRRYKEIRIKPSTYSLVVNEIMYNPSAGEPEWIELYNNSADTVNLNNWYVSDVIATPTILLLTKRCSIAPGAYFIVARDSSIFNYHKSITAGIYTGSLPVLNNDEDGVVLKDFTGSTIDSVFYKSTMGGKNGYSLERISTSSGSLANTNWGSSTDVELSTPGRKNSIAAKVFDVKTTSVFTVPANPVRNQPYNIGVKVTNNGTVAVAGFGVNFYTSADTTPVNLKFAEEVTYPAALKQNDTCVIISANQYKCKNPEFVIRAGAVLPQDEDTSDNSAQSIIRQSESKNSVLVNEIMYYPKNDEPEWVELVNNTENAINLKGWTIGDIYTVPVKAILSTKDYYFNSGEYLVVARDSSFFKFNKTNDIKVLIASFGQLNNGSDGITVCDYRDSVITQTVYQSSWGCETGKSVERVSLANMANDSSNWKLSLNAGGSTPGKINSVVNMPVYKKNSAYINEILFSPAEDNCEYVEIINPGPDSLNIGGWSITNSRGTKYTLITDYYYLPKNSYFVAAADSIILNKYPYLSEFPGKRIMNTSGLGLENAGGIVVLKDYFGNTIDSAIYDANWENKKLQGTENRSLEKINYLSSGLIKESWASSVNSLFGTPGKENSTIASVQNRGELLSVKPNPFSPDNDGYEDVTTISYNLNKPSAQVRVKIFDSKGRLVRTIINAQQNGSSGSIIFNGFDDSGNALRMGIYIIYLEASCADGSTEAMKCAVVIARKL